MDRLVTDVNGDVRSLMEWRQRIMEPFTNEMKGFREDTLEYIHRSEAIQDERHRVNSFKLNLSIALWTAMGAIISLIMLFKK